MLNPNLASKISYERILNNFQNEAVNRSGVYYFLSAGVAPPDLEIRADTNELVAVPKVVNYETLLTLFYKILGVYFVEIIL